MVNILKAVATFCMLAALCMPLAASTGYPNEITGIHFENVTQTSLDVVWTTVHASTSQVIVARDFLYEPDHWVPAAADPNLVTIHRVHLDRLLPYNSATGDGQYYIYVASKDATGVLSTAPGPQTNDGRNPLLSLRTLPTNTTGAPSFAIYTFGPIEVFAGSDMYFEVQSALISGPVSGLYIHNTGGYNNGTDGVVKYVTGSSFRGNPETIGVHFSCVWANPTGADSAEQNLDRSRNLGYCPGENNIAQYLTIRLRTRSNTIPGNYSVAFTLDTNGQQQTSTYDFTVLPAAKPQARAQLTLTAIPGLANWQYQMTYLGNKWCSYRDQQNVAGQFVDNWGWTADAWFYDGGRVYQNIDTYTAAQGRADHAHWQHCALTLLDPYANYQVANNGAMQAYDIFTVGQYQWSLRTGSALARSAVNALATLGPQRASCGNVDPHGIRENSYRSVMWMENELLGAPRHPLLRRNIDKLVGNVAMFANGQGGDIHPFMVGLAMEALIHWYDLTTAEGNPDYRVLPVIHEGLEGLRRYSWLPQQNMMDYNRFTLPPLRNISSTELNNLVSVAYAWYWQQTGDTSERDLGDLLFQHAFDSPGSGWSGKQFSQGFEFSFDFVRYRQALSPTFTAANNPMAGPYADTEPPINERVNCDPNYYRGCQAGTIGRTTATIFWTTYKPSNTQVIYGPTTDYGWSTNLNPAMVLAHSARLVALQPNTTYHFRPRSVDSNGNVGSMHDLTFTTSR